MVLKVLNDIIIEILKEKVNSFTRIELVELLKQKGYNYTKSQIIYILNSKEIKSKLKYDINTQKYSLNDDEKNYEINDTKTKLIQEEIKPDFNNPAKGWDSYEVTLALALYFDKNRGPIHKKNKKIIELSGFLNVYTLSKSKILNTTFRSPSSVALKLSNFLALDSNYIGKGMSSYSKLDFELFNYYENRQNELNETANQIKQLVAIKTINPTPNNENGITSHINNPLKKVKEPETYNHIRENRKEVEGLSIPERCKNIITSIGSLNDANNYFIKYENFYKIRNCGKINNDLLVDFFKNTYNSNFNNIIKNDKIVEIANPLENISNETILFKNVDLSTLSERSLNVLLTFNNFSDVLKYFSETKSFIYIRNCGVKSNNELKNFILTYLSNKKDSIQIKIENPIKNINYWIYEKLRRQDNFTNTLIYLEEYYFNKFSINIYENLEIFNGNLNDVFLALDFEKIENKHKKTIELFSIVYKRCLNLNHINILTINPIPEFQDRSKTPILISFINKSIIKQSNSTKEYFNLLKIFYTDEQVIRILATNNIKQYNEVSVANSSNEIETLLTFISSIIQYFNKLNHVFLNNSSSETFYTIKQTLSNLQIEDSLKLIEFVDNHQIVEIINLIVSKQIHYEKQKLIIDKLFFDLNYENVSMENIAKELNLSRERIRQIKSNYSNNIILKTFNYLNFLNLFNSLLNGSTLKYLMPFNSNFINGQYFNFESLPKLTAYFPNNFIEIQELTSELNFENIYFNSSRPILVNLNIISKDDLIKILNSFNTDNSKSFLEYLYNLPNFNEIIDLKEFSELLSKKQSFQNRGNKLDKEFIIANEVRKFLKISGKPTKTENILNFLISENYEIDRLALLKILNSKKEIFTIFGQGNWALISWRELGMLEGDLIDIIRNLLNDSENPLHISEIFYYLNEFSPTSFHSILTNLKVTEKYKFKFFNCSFIGLSEKKYSNYYYNLPLVVGFHFNQSKIDNLNLSTWDDILKYYEQEFKYPRIHVEHLLMNNIDL